MAPEVGPQLHNEDAEASVLGAALLSPKAASLALESLTVDDFYKPAYQEVFQTISMLAAVGTPVDAITVADMLRRRQLLDRLGGVSMLTGLMEAPPAVSNVDWYIGIVKDLAQRRRAIRLYMEAIARANDLTVPFDTTMRIVPTQPTTRRFAGGVDV